jgi:putative oxidoreductase
VCLQRLFSTFAGGWPGAGILLQRLLTAGALLYCAIAHLQETAAFPPIILQLIAAGAGIFLLLGLCTPIVGVLIAIVEMWIAFLRADGLLLSILLTMLGASLAMIGPGAWSIDARLFGRKHIKTPSI